MSAPMKLLSFKFSLANNIRRAIHVRLFRRKYTRTLNLHNDGSISRQTSHIHTTSSRQILSELKDRGLIQTIFPDNNIAGLEQNLNSSSQCLYCGFDPTADSLHIGNLLALIALLHYYRRGHQCIALIGGATALIGDPSGRTSERKALSAEEIQTNIQSISNSLERIFNNYSLLIHRTSDELSNIELKPIKILNNADWYKEQNVVDFLSNIGRHFRMGQLLSRYSVKSRLQSSEGMNFTEFTYQVFQAYDWLHLFKTYNCSIQIGGNDQMGNIAAGYELINRVCDTPVYSITVPLVTSTTGSKLGKSAGNAVWLNADKTSPLELYQFFFNLRDPDADKYLRLFTFLSDGELSEIASLMQISPEQRHAQKKVAEQLTLLVHGADGLETAQNCTDALYNGNVEALSSLSKSDLQQLLKNVPTLELPYHSNQSLQAVCMMANCFKWENDADRIIRAGGVHINHMRMSDPDMPIEQDTHILSNGITLIRVGKKNYYMIKWIQT